MADDGLLAAIFGSSAFGHVLGVFAEHPGELLAAGEVGRLAGVTSRDSLYRAIDRAIRSGLVLRRSFGRMGAYEVNTGSPLYPEVKALLSKATGPAAELQAILARHPGVKAAFVYGSTASGEDTASSDVDLFVVGEVDEPALVEDLHGVETSIDREVNALVLPPDALQRRLTSGDPLLADVWRRPRLMLVGAEDGLPAPAVTEPNPFFHQEMAVGGAARPYASVVAGAAAGRVDEVPERALDVVASWVGRVRPDATSERASSQVGWWQVRDAERGASWQAWLYPGPVLSVRALAPAVPRGVGSVAVGLRDLVAWWHSTLSAVLLMLAELRCAPVQAGLTLNTNPPADGPRIVDVDFAGLAAPTPGAVPGQVPPWTHAVRSFDLPTPAAGIIEQAARSLLRHYSYRHLDETIRSLGPTLRAPAGP